MADEKAKALERKYIAGFVHEKGYAFTIEAESIADAIEKVMAKTKVRRREVMVTFFSDTIAKYPTIDEWLKKKAEQESDRDTLTDIQIDMFEGIVENENKKRRTSNGRA